MLFINYNRKLINNRINNRTKISKIKIKLINLKFKITKT